MANKLFISLFLLLSGCSNNIIENKEIKQDIHISGGLGLILGTYIDQNLIYNCSSTNKVGFDCNLNPPNKLTLFDSYYAGVTSKGILYRISAFKNYDTAISDNNKIMCEMDKNQLVSLFEKKYNITLDHQIQMYFKGYNDLDERIIRTNSGVNVYISCYKNYLNSNGRYTLSLSYNNYSYYMKELDILQQKENQYNTTNI